MTERLAGKHYTMSNGTQMANTGDRNSNGSLPLTTSSIEILVDARCLQDPRFRDRGIGHHAATMLAAADRFSPAGITPILTAGVDRTLPPLKPEHRQLFDSERSLATPGTPNSIFIQLSPMTHTPRPLDRLLTTPSIRTIAIVYDFIPLDEPDRYLPAVDAQKEYFECLAALGDYHQFISISEFSNTRLRDLLEVPPHRTGVSGVAVRESVIRAEAVGDGAGGYVLAVLGGDPRKNAELPITAHARSTSLHDARIALKIVGHYSREACENMRALHCAEGGDPSLLEFIEGISDEQLSSLYQHALVTVCPSRTEGFSIPVVEANANQCPVIISNCDAHVELLPLPEYQFDADDADHVSAMLETFLDPGSSAIARVRQGQFWEKFETTKVQERFWRFVFDVQTPSERLQGPFVLRGARPRIAVASPVPPDASGVADFTAATMSALALRADVDIYTETQRPAPSTVYAGIHPLSAEPYSRRTHDGVISVVGNSHYHSSILDLLLSYGGACIAHDARMVHFYAALTGQERTINVASRETGRAVEWNEIESWIANQRRMPILFLSEILEAAEPTFVHSPSTQAIVKDIYGKQAVHLPFAIYRKLSPEFEGPAGRLRARTHLGYGDEVKLVVTLGDLVEDKAIPECIWTAAMLAQWGVPIRLALVGRSSPETRAYLHSLIDALGLHDNVHISDGMVDERTYQAYLAGADAAIQFRTYGFGGLSGALLDQISVGLPTVANAHLAEAMEAPDYVARIPDGLSPVLAAEQLMALFDRGERANHEESRRAFVDAHSVELYAGRLLEGMNLA